MKATSKSVLMVLALLAAIFTSFPVQATDDYRHGKDRAGAVYSMTNDPDGNAIAVFGRDSKGMLEFEGAVDTGGLGSGGGLDEVGSQGSIIMSKDKRWLLAVNAGSDEISVFRIWRDYLVLVDKVYSGGTFPRSLTLYHDLLYVLNNDSPNIVGFNMDHRGRLRRLGDSTSLPEDGSYSQIMFDNSGDRLIVTDRGNQEILVFEVDDNGIPEDSPAVSPSEGAGPFGFILDRRGHLIVSEAGEGAVSSYNVLDDGGLMPISSSVKNDQMATCWIAGNNRYVFTSNTASGNLSSYKTNRRTGRLRILEKIAGTGNLPLDMDTTENGRFLYVLNAGDATVGMFAIARNGKLIDLGTVEGPFEIYAQGMVAR